MALTQLPPPDDPAVFVYQDGERHGPISRRELQTKVLANEVKSNEHFWYQGMEGWESIGDHPELFDGLAPPAAGGGTAGLETVRLSTADIAAVQQAVQASRTTADIQAARQEAEPAAAQQEAEPAAAQPFAAAETAFLSPADLAAAQAEAQATDSSAFEAEPAVVFEAEPAVELEAEPAVELEAEPAAVEFELEAEPAAVELEVEPAEEQPFPFAGAQTAFITPEQMAAAQAEAQGGAVFSEDAFSEEAFSEEAFSEEAVSEAEAVATIDPEPEVLGESSTTPRTEPLLAETEDDRLDAVFGTLVNQSWDLVTKREFAGHVDEVFLGAVITSTLDNGYSLIDLTSDGDNHYLRFENLDTGTRLIFRLRHLTGDLVTSKVLGQQASVVIGYGEKSKDISSVFSALKAEFKSGFIMNAEPGTITIDGDLTSGYVYAQVDLYLSIDDYVGTDYATDYALLTEHIGGTTHALRKYLRSRFA